MSLLEITQIITKKSFLQMAGTGNIIELVRLDTNTYEFGGCREWFKRFFYKAV